jgi:hypothetical protein
MLRLRDPPTPPPETSANRHGHFVGGAARNYVREDALRKEVKTGKTPCVIKAGRELPEREADGEEDVVGFAQPACLL